MHDFRYVSKSETAPVKADLLDIIHEVQNYVRDKFTFQYEFIGSSARNMITCDTKSNIGFDFDVNLYVNDDNEEYSAEEIRRTIKKALDEVAPQHGYDYAEDSTRVLTIKVKNTRRAKVLHSCDFAIVYDCEDGRQQYIRFNKDRNNYTWEYQGKGFDLLPEKEEWLRDNNLWQEVRDYYIEKKNRNVNPEKHSRSIFAETITEICQKNGYYE
jgi:hypothetical protein